MFRGIRGADIGGSTFSNIGGNKYDRNPTGEHAPSVSTRAEQSSSASPNTFPPTSPGALDQNRVRDPLTSTGEAAIRRVGPPAGDTCPPGGASADGVAEPSIENGPSREADGKGMGVVL